MADSPDRDEQEQASAQDGAEESAAGAVAPTDEAVEQKKATESSAEDESVGDQPSADVDATAHVGASDEEVEAAGQSAADEGAESAADEQSSAVDASAAQDEAPSTAESSSDDAEALSGERGPDALESADASGEAESLAEETVAEGEDLSANADVAASPEGDAGTGGDASADTDEDLGRATADLKSIVEALIFASPEPLTPKALMKLLDSEPKEDVLAALDAVKAVYEEPGGLQLVEVAGGFQIVTRPDLHEWVRRLFHERSTQKLSVQALETLAVIAYRQPITALEITEIRGVSASGVLNTLLERHLIKIVGRKQVVGRPFMYATTKEFLIRFGLKDLTDLPKVEDMAESLGIESPLLVEQTPPEEQLPLSEPEPDDSGDDGGHLPAADRDEEPTDDDSGEPTIN